MGGKLPFAKLPVGLVLQPVEERSGSRRYFPAECIAEHIVGIELRFVGHPDARDRRCFENGNIDWYLCRSKMLQRIEGHWAAADDRNLLHGQLVPFQS